MKNAEGRNAMWSSSLELTLVVTLALGFVSGLTVSLLLRTAWFWGEVTRLKKRLTMLSSKRDRDDGNP